MDDILLCKYFNNQATADEIGQIEHWLESDEAHREEFDAMHMVFNMMLMREIRATATDRERAGAERLARPGTGRRTLRKALRFGAAAVLAACIGTAGLHLGRIHTLEDIGRMTQSMEVPAGKQVSVTLPDGTGVCLNGGSRIEYPPVFTAGERRVKISGEGLFSVAHDAARPFIVETFASEVEALGTVFNVYADGEHSRFSTTLAEGKVRIRLLEGGDPVILRPDEMAVLENGRLVKRAVRAEDAFCWTDGYINVSNVSFEELMSRFEQAFGVDIFIARPTMPGIGYVSGKIRVSEGVEFALRLLQKASDFEFEIDRATNTVVIK